MVGSLFDRRNPQRSERERKAKSEIERLRIRGRRRYGTPSSHSLSERLGLGRGISYSSRFHRLVMGDLIDLERPLPMDTRNVDESCGTDFMIQFSQIGLKKLEASISFLLD